MSSLHFDAYQFAGRRSQPVNAEFTQSGWTSNGVAFEDFTRMQSRSVSPRHKRWTPAFAANDEKLRHVLLCRAWFYLHNSGRPDCTPADWKKINAAATKKTMEIFTTSFAKCPAHKRRESAAHVAAVKQAGGYLELQAALVYHGWRLGEDSVTIGETLGMSPQAVRVNLQRLCEVARQLGYDTFRRHFSFGRLRPKRNQSPVVTTPKNINMGLLITLYKAGKNVSQIAQAIGYEKNHGNNRVRHALMKAGIYKEGASRELKKGRHAGRPLLAEELLPFTRPISSAPPAGPRPLCPASH